jgi:hypothetical protein
MPNDSKTTQPPEMRDHYKAWEANCATLVEGQKQVLTRYVEGLRALSDDLSEIARERLRLSLEAWSTLVACRNAEDVLDCHNRLVAKCTEQSVKEITKLSQLAMTMVGRAEPRERPG